ncbi:MAG: hypothetical protein RLZZ104_1535 [Pseudomonadota bacterium]
MNRAGRRRKVSVTLATSAHMEMAKAVVDDPYERGAKAEVLVNIREHPISRMHHAGQISDSQRIAAEAFRAHYERSVLGGQKAIDYTKERVDGGLPAEPLTEAAQRATQWLVDVARYSGCGQTGYAILTHVCGEGRGIQETAKRFRGSGAPGGMQGNGWVLGVLVTSLEALIQHLGMEAVGRRPRR